MDHQLYIRLRGRVLGPYDTAKLQVLAKRGQLSRMHEVSPDSINWVSASKYPDLFVSDEIPPGSVYQQSRQAAQQVPAINQESASSAARRWWYRKNGSQVGPVEETVVQQCLASGTLSLDDYVWTEGMPQWIPLRKAPQLAPTQLTSPGDFPFQKDASEHDLSLSLCKAAFNSRSWVIFIAIVAFIYAGLSIVVGIILLMLGANQHLPLLVAGGLFGLVYGIDALIGGSLLASYASRLNGLRYGNKDIVLEKAMDSLRTFWIFVSINLILLLGVIVFFAIWLIAVAGSVPLSW